MYLRIGSKGNLVREVQGKLTELGFNPGLIDGIFGNKTRKAVVRFQEDKTLQTDGIVGPATFKALGIAVKPIGPEQERAKFRELLLVNPNYFGNLKVSKFKAVKPKKNDTSYEELKCVGYDPHVEQLHAVVHIKKDYGYGGDICSTGSPEYVRFYIDWDNDGNWIDVGMARFTAYNLPGDKPLEYSVTLDIDPKEKHCTVENLPKVRAILSWYDPPTPDDPDYPPVWGNVMEARIQIDDLEDVMLADLFEMGKIALPANLLKNLDVSQSVSIAKAKELSVGELAQVYKDKGVPGHRFAFTKLQKMLCKPVVASVANLELTEALAGLDVQVSEIVEALAAKDGDTSYEELKCVGYDPQRRHLTGILTVKLPNGYSGDLCKKGSNEYVAFWEWDEIEAMWLYLGTAVVNVHDIQGIPNDGLQYAVSLGGDFAHRRWPCTGGPSEARIRAILSWEDPPPSHNPNWVPKWGNREETRIHIKPGPQPTGENIPYIETVGNMHACDIKQDTGLATGEGMIAHFDADRSPFARTIRITGFIDYPPTGVMEGGSDPLQYRVYVRPYDPATPKTWQQLTNSFSVWVKEKDDLNPWIHRKVTQELDTEGYYTYLEDPGGLKRREYVLPILASWHTNKPMSGLWEMRIEAKKGSTVIPGGTFICEADGTTRSIVKVRLDNEKPDVSIYLTGYQRGSDPTVHPIGTGTPEKCGKFLKGDVLHGSYSVSDEYFGKLTLTVHPDDPAHGAMVNPPVRSFDVVPTTGESGTWTLDTSVMDPCGYIVRLWARDRGIVDSGNIGLRRTDDVGFCLELPEEEEGT